MNLLVCNDDGIQSEGILVLAKLLNKRHNVTVIAPDVNRTASSHAMTVGKKLALVRRDIGDGIEAYSFSGTPADCVKFALNTRKGQFDAVISGINKGPNLGTDVMYSGTVSAALEALLFHVPAVAVSSAAEEGNLFEPAAEILEEMLEDLLSSATDRFAWNVNVPNLRRTDVRGVRYTPLGVQLYSDHYAREEGELYTLGGCPIEHGENPEDCDVEWCKKGYVTVTPVLLDKTDYATLDRMKRRAGGREKEDDGENVK